MAECLLCVPPKQPDLLPFCISKRIKFHILGRCKIIAHIQIYIKIYIDSIQYHYLVLLNSKSCYV